MGVEKTTRRLLVGVGGTGKSTLLKRWVSEANGEATWLTGHARRPIPASKLSKSLNDTTSTLVLDELQWFSDEALELLADEIEQTSAAIYASRRPWPTSDVLDHVSSLLTQTTPTPTWTLREQLLWSSLNAGLARRSGDMTRLRNAWTAAEGVILEASPSWIYLELLHDIVVAGDRLGELDRVRPLIDDLSTQANVINGDVAIAALWLDLNVALATDDNEALAQTASKLAEATPVTKRSAARCAAAQLWVDVVANRHGTGQNLDEQAILNCAEQVAADADPWQAARLLGQAALDEQDPKAARRLLEKARDVVVEVSGVTTNNFSDLGLSDREAEVALLVALSGLNHDVDPQSPGHPFRP